METGNKHPLFLAIGLKTVPEILRDVMDGVPVRKPDLTDFHVAFLTNTSWG